MKKNLLLFLVIVLCGALLNANAQRVSYGTDITRTTATPTVTFKVDMSDAENFDPASDVVYITGDIFGWAEPGTDLENQTMTQVGETWIWAADVELEAGTYEYKYFLNSGWDNGEWAGGANRKILVEETMEKNDIWGLNYSLAYIETFDLMVDDASVIDEITIGDVVDGEATISIMVAEGTTISALTPTITISMGASITSDTPTNTVADFTDPVFYVVTSGDGQFTYTYEVNVDVASSAEVNILSDLNVYPNPFTTEIRIANAENVARITITNLIGQVVMDMPYRGETTINTSDLNNGLYLVVFQSANGQRVVRKMIKQ